MVPLALAGLMLNAKVSMPVNIRVNIIVETVLLNKPLPPNLNGCVPKIMIVERCSMQYDFFSFPFHVYLSAASIQRSSPFLHRFIMTLCRPRCLNSQSETIEPSRVQTDQTTDFSFSRARLEISSAWFFPYRAFSAQPYKYPFRQIDSQLLTKGWAMKRTCVIFLAILLFAILVASLDGQKVKAEPSTMQWTKTYGGTSEDYARALVQTTEGGYALAGYTQSFGAGGDEAWQLKTDASGNALWNKTYNPIARVSEIGRLEESEGRPSRSKEFNSPLKFANSLR